ncbi:cytochrome P450 family protein [Prauserella endophytica]|uniref:Cytochrome P450 n=1 Tax=Prauserella endophytica TaxID=1592324 RepID=A0ABY2S3L2_9PSEU|nr:cytochrome P450 [Prauserella endophytica]TKG69178.1 cytochrome P450 [Prauserella endophytica]
MTSAVPEITLADPAVITDPFTAYAPVRERSAVARLTVPGLAPMWGVLRHAEARAMLSDPRFELSEETFALRPDVPDDCKPYMRTMQEMEGGEHTRLRRLVAPAFTARRAQSFRPRIERIVDGLLDELTGRADGGVVDLLRYFARPLPMDVICELVGIPRADRLRWRGYGTAVAAGIGEEFGRAIPGIIEGARKAVAARRAEPADDLIGDLIRAQAEDGDRLSDVELVTLVWSVVLGGQTPTNLIANCIATLLAHPGQLELLRENPALLPGAVEELTRWCGPQLLTMPRFAREDAELAGTPVRKGDSVTVVLASVNRDPRVFADPDTLDVTRAVSAPGHLGYAHGPHFCLGAALARVQTEVALAALLRRFPGLAAAGEATRMPDPGTWRLTELPVALDLQ